MGNFVAAPFKGEIMSRREIREHIFKILFGVDFYGTAEMKEQMDLYFDQALDDDLANPPSFVPQEDREYIREKAERIAAKVPEIDQEIDRVAKGWKTGRMARADLAILRLAVYEMRWDEDIPVNVAINEAVELAKKFGSDESPAFINGILAKLA